MSEARNPRSSSGGYTIRPESDFFSGKKGKQMLHFLVHCALIVAAVFYIFPFLWMLGSSLKTAGQFFTDGINPIPADAHWENYVKAWTRANFGSYFWNTFFVTGMTVFFTILFSSAAGYVLSRNKLPGKGVIIGAILVTVFLPAGYTILPIFEMVKAMGLLGSLWAVIVTQVGCSLVFSTFLFMGYFKTIPDELEEAAKIDGATVPRTYWSIFLPLAGPISATVALFSFMGSWNNFLVPLIFSNGNPALRTLAVGMFVFQSENSRDWTLMCAGAVITILPVILQVMFLQRYFIEGISGAVKQ